MLKKTLFTITFYLGLIVPCGLALIWAKLPANDWTTTVFQILSSLLILWWYDFFYFRLLRIHQIK